MAALFKFKTEKEVVELANDTDVGLAAYFFSTDYSRIWRVAEALDGMFPQPGPELGYEALTGG